MAISDTTFKKLKEKGELKCAVTDKYNLDRLTILGQFFPVMVSKIVKVIGEDQVDTRKHC